MANAHPLTPANADRSCAECGEEATAFVHGEGFYCGSCHEAAPPERVSRRPSDADGS